MAERSLTLYLPNYAQAERFLRVIDGTRSETFERMMQDIYSLVGKNRENVKIGDPDSWIPQLVRDESSCLAMRIWQESSQLVNPRWSKEQWRFVNTHLLVEEINGVCALTDFGKRFVDVVEVVVSQIDEREGIYLVLSELADKGSSSLKELFGEFRAFCRLHTKWADATMRSALRYRLNNLRFRGFVDRKGYKYEITDAGLAHVQEFIGSGDSTALAVQLAVSDWNRQARRQLLAFLGAMDPFKFEHLVARLFEAMEYDNVELTPYLNDQGVDIKADIEFGVSSVHEVIQVKRQKGSIGQPTVSALRGAMPLFNALRGSIVTTGSFSKKAREIAVVVNAPPISLIDGERLLDLLIEHDIGIRKREIRIVEFDEASLCELVSEDELVVAALEEEPENV